jgi:ATP-binding cassette subfamily E protein 1
MYFVSTAKVPMLNVSYKPQKISPKSQGTVRQLLHEKIRDAYIHPQFITDVIKPLQVEQLYDQEVCFVTPLHLHCCLIVCR